MEPHPPSLLSSLNETYDKIIERLKFTAHELKLSFSAFGSIISVEPDAAGQLSVSTSGPPSEPAPITPADDSPYHLLAGTIRKTWETGKGKDSGVPIFVSPGVMFGMYHDHLERLLNINLAAKHSFDS